MARPLVVCDPAGRPITALLINEKGVKKTLERGELWALHPETGRLLPAYEGVPATLEDRGSWYHVTVSSVPSGEPFVGAGDTSGPVSAEATTPTEGAARAQGGGRNRSQTTGSVEPDSVEPGSAEPGAAATEIGAVMADLAGVIGSRRREMPEGSYTTHLFSSGSEKIRKKLGEEAVELILASNRENLTSETADLLYHLLVLLEAEGVSLSEIAAELRRR